MSRFVALVVLAILIWMILEWLVRQARRSVMGRRISLIWNAAQQVRQNQGAGAARSTPSRPATDELVRCRICGIFIPRSRAVSEPPATTYICASCRSERAAS